MLQRNQCKCSLSSLSIVVDPKIAPYPSSQGGVLFYVLSHWGRQVLISQMSATPSKNRIGMNCRTFAKAPSPIWPAEPYQAWDGYKWQEQVPPLCARNMHHLMMCDLHDCRFQHLFPDISTQPCMQPFSISNAVSLMYSKGVFTLQASTPSCPWGPSTTRTEPQLEAPGSHIRWQSIAEHDTRHWEGNGWGTVFPRSFSPGSSNGYLIWI